MPLPHHRLREIATSFLDAVEQGDVATVRYLYAPAMRFWVNMTGEEKTGEENVATQIAGQKLAASKSYNDRTIDIFDDGFLARYTINIVTLGRRKVALSACIVVRCDCDGQITRIDEYLDAGKLPSRSNPKAA